MSRPQTKKELAEAGRRKVRISAQSCDSATLRRLQACMVLLQLEAFRKQKAAAKASKAPALPIESSAAARTHSADSLHPEPNGTAANRTQEDAVLSRVASVLPLSTPAMPFDDGTSADEDTFFTDTFRPASPLQMPSVPASISDSSPASAQAVAKQIPFMNTGVSTIITQPAPPPVSPVNNSTQMLRPVPYKSRLPPPPPPLPPPPPPPPPKKAPISFHFDPTPQAAAEMSAATTPKQSSESPPTQNRRLPPPLVPFQPMRKASATATHSSSAAPQYSRSNGSIEQQAGLSSSARSGSASAHSAADLARDVTDQSSSDMQQNALGLGRSSGSLFSPQLELHEERQAIPEVATSRSAATSKSTMQPPSLFSLLIPSEDSLVSVSAVCLLPWSALSMRGQAKVCVA